MGVLRGDDRRIDFGDTAAGAHPGEAMPSPSEREVREAYARFVAQRDEAEAGRVPWRALADFYTEDGVTIDPVWGRIEGRENIRVYCEKSMAGLTGYGWSSRERWTMVDGPRVVSQWDQILGWKEDRTPWFVPGLSILYYARDGLFCYEHQLIDPVHLGEVMRAMGWKPNAELNAPPANPNRDLSLPRAWAHLEKNRP
jgi:SnoaL-like protein